MSTRVRVRRPLLWALLASLAVHLAGIVFLALQRPAAKTVTPVAAQNSDAQPITPTVGEVQRLIDHEARFQSRRSRPDQLAELDRRAEALKSIDAGEVQRMAGLIESAMGASPVQRAMEPIASATGAFDADSASLYDITRKTRSDGSVVYEHLLVDAAGRTLRDERPEAQMSPQDFAAFRVFELARENPRLRTLIDLVRRRAEASPSAAPAD